MQYTSALQQEAAIAQTVDPALTASGTEHVPRMLDRAAPGWTRSVSIIFATLSAACLLSVAILSLFFDLMVAQRGELILAPLLFGVALVPIFGSVLLDLAHHRALTGWRASRETTFAAASAVLAGLASLVLTVVHPLLIGPVALAVGFGWSALTLSARRRMAEPAWDVRPEEAVSVLAGRDAIGLAMARRAPEERAGADAIHRAAVWTGVLGAIAATSWLVARDVLAEPSILAVALITFWSVDAALRFLRQRAIPALPERERPALVEGHVVEPAEDEDLSGLRLRNLQVGAPGRAPLLTGVSFDVLPGSMTGIVGESGAGKSLLLQALVDPFGLTGLEVRGSVTVNGTPLWLRESGERTTPVAYVPADTPLLAGGGADNLACLHDGPALARARHILETFVFSTEAVDAICAAPDAARLPGMQRRALAFARAFMLSPQLYLFDLPETALPERQIGLLIARLKQEQRLGRSILVVTENRPILEACDHLVALQGSKVIDHGDAAEMRKRLSTGWHRFVGERRLETEDNLHSWIRSQFKRNGDEANRRTVCRLASELLALSCQSADVTRQETIRFEFKQFKGHCVLKMYDSGAVATAAQLDLARQRAQDAEKGVRLPPLAALVAGTRKLEVTEAEGERIHLIDIASYDPRLGQTTAEAPNAAK